MERRTATRCASLGSSRVSREAVPEARLTDDVDARRADVTWDIGERVRLPEDRVRRRSSRMIAAAGARSFASSVHVHATYDTDDKASGAVAYLARAFGEDPGAVTGARWAFVGDSGNDAACFSAFRTDVRRRQRRDRTLHVCP